MLTNGDWTYTWNGENRLVVAEAADKRLEFTYDYMGRRVRKQVYTGSSGNWTLASENKYVYDSWNCIAIFDDRDAMMKSYLWGEDLSGSLQGAGGVGGLLAVTDATATYFPMYDGNGNIMTYVDASGTIQADYTYDPFGRTISQSGDSAAELIYRFSTKPLDTETNLYYYGYRYYSPDLSRWLSRDPIEEEGGVNIYGFVANSPINTWDYLGMNYSFKNMARRVGRLYSDGFLREAAIDANQMYFMIAAGGKLKGYKLSSKLMFRWLLEKGDYTLNSNELKRIFDNDAVQDSIIYKLNKAGKKFTRIENLILSEIRTYYDLGAVIPDKDIHYALGEFSIKFSGCYGIDGSIPGKMKVKIIDGKFNVIDIYDWQNPKGKYVELAGAYIFDKWAENVENHGFAKRFDVNGEISFQNRIFTQNKDFSRLK